MATNLFEPALITKIIDEKDIRTPIKYKITTEFFTDSQCRATYAWLMDWFRNPAYGDTPSWDSFFDVFNSFERVDIEDSTVALCDKLRGQKLYNDISGVINDVSTRTRGDSIDGFSALRGHTARLTAEHTVDDSADVRSRVDDIRKEYLAMKEQPDGLKGRAYPWPALNHATLGCQDGQYVMLYGRPKSGKTWLLLEMIRAFHAAGALPIVFSQELSDIEIARRYVALATNVDYDKMLRGQLEQDAELEFFDNLEMFQEQPPIIISQLTSMGQEAILVEMAAKIDEYNANVAAIDGVYFLGNDVKEIVAVTRAAKRLAKQKKIPILGTTQRLRPKNQKVQEQSTGDDVYGSDSYLQDCDLLLMVESSHENRRNKEAIITTAAIREGKGTRFMVNMKFCEDMTEKYVMRSSDDEGEEAEEQLEKVDKEEDNRE